MIRLALLPVRAGLLGTTYGFALVADVATVGMHITHAIERTIR